MSTSKYGVRLGKATSQIKHVVKYCHGHPKAFSYPTMTNMWNGVLKKDFSKIMSQTS